jgi:tetratricopeptide (TPR) repeat protein
MPATLSPSCRPPAEKGRLLAEAAAHLSQGRLLEAGRLYFELLRLEPDCLEALARLGAILFELGQFQQSLPCLDKAVRLAPGTPKLHLLRGAILKRLGRLEESAACCRRELEISPQDPDAHYNLGLTLQNLNRAHEAVPAYRRAVALRPGYVDALVGLGAALRQTGQPEEALGWFEQAIEREPNNAEPHWELCTTLLSLGRFEGGWKEYEWRWKLRDFTTPPCRFPQPLWDGTNLAGRRIFLHCEQGFGDILQFCRYATLVARRQGEVILGCPRALRSLLETVPGVREVVTARSGPARFDVHAPLMSLPAIFGTRLETIPAEAPYLRAPAPDAASAPWVEPGPGLKAGLVWAGDPGHRNDRNRSVSLAHFRPLLELPGIRWFSLQVGQAAAELKLPGIEGRIVDLGSRFASFGDTAQAVAQLDLVISVDTAVAHLAGALGKPVWTLLPFEAEWRWMVARPDSPWYPTMRLFRQTAPGAWPGLREQVGRELIALADSQGRGICAASPRSD